MEIREIAGSEVLLRDAVPDDAEAVAPLLGELDHPAEPGEVRERLARLRLRGEGEYALVAERAGRVVGFMTVHLTPVVHRETDVARITAIVVTSAERGTGVGRALVAEAEAIAARYGSIRLELTSGDERVEAHRFYERLGFHREGVRFARSVPPV